MNKILSVIMVIGLSATLASAETPPVIGTNNAPEQPDTQKDNAPPQGWENGNAYMMTQAFMPGEKAGTLFVQDALDQQYYADVPAGMPPRCTTQTTCDGVAKLGSDSVPLYCIVWWRNGTKSAYYIPTRGRQPLAVAKGDMVSCVPFQFIKVW